MREFIRKYIFFKVDKETYRMVLRKGKNYDSKGFQAAAILIAVFQVIMMIISIARKGWSWSGYVVPYRILYLVLAMASVLCCLLLGIMKKKDSRTVAFYGVIIIYMYIVLAWGIGISILDSHAAPVIITYSYVTLTCAAFIIISPWAFIGAAALTTIALNLTLYFYPGAMWATSVLINSVSVFVLASMVSVYTFYRRINSFILEDEVQELNNELAAKAYIDDLTKLYNRRYLSESMSEPLDYSKDGSGIILLDIDNFKQVNDTYGHLSGDAVLEAVGRIIHNQEFQSYCIRYGGEEILVYFQAVSDAALYMAAEKIRSEVEQEKIKITNGNEISVTVSLGIAKARNNVTYSVLIDQADEALYQAKGSGKNKTVWFQNETKEAE